MQEIYIFTYGTLKRDFPNNYFLDNAIFISKAITCDNYQMYPCNNKSFPFLSGRKEFGQRAHSHLAT